MQNFFLFFYLKIKYLLRVKYQNMDKLQNKLLIKKKRDEMAEKIFKRLNEEERRLSWLSKKTGISYATLYNCLVHRISSFSETNLIKINDVLGTKLKSFTNK